MSTSTKPRPVAEYIPKPDFFSVLNDGANKPTYYATANNRIAFATISTDMDPLLPVSVQWGQNGDIDRADYDGEGSILIFRNQYDADYGSYLVRKKHAIPLSKYEHSLVKWDIMGQLNAPDAQFDQTTFAGVWVPDEQVFDNLGHKGKKGLLKYCKPIIDNYTAFCNGDVWAYKIVIYPVMVDADGNLITDREEYEETVQPLETIDEAPGQFYGDESVIEEIENVLQHKLKGRMFDGYHLNKKGHIDPNKPKYKYTELPPVNVQGQGQE